MLARNTLVNGDCLEIMKEIEEGSIDMILCDLPYGTTKCSWDTIIPFEPLWEQYKRIIKKNGAIVLFGSEPFSSKLRMSNMDWFKYDWIWVKNNAGNFQLCKEQPLKVHENISVFIASMPEYIFSDIIKKYLNSQPDKASLLSDVFLSKNGNKTGGLFNKLSGAQLPTKEQWLKICSIFDISYDYDSLIERVAKIKYNPNLESTFKINTNKNKGGRLAHLSVKTDHYVQNHTNYPKSLLYFDRPNKPIHPTQKPVDLCEYLIKTYTNEGDLVLDNCCGSGTTGLAAINTNRDYILIEKDENYFNTAKNRLDEAITSKNGLDFC